MKIQYASDLYVDKLSVITDVIHANADVLVLAGDIGCPRKNSYKEFLKYCANNFEHIIIISGNYEYHSSYPYTFEQVDLEIRNICESISPKIHYLYDGLSVVISDIQFIGATLWSKIEQNDIDNKEFQKMWRDQKRSGTIEWNALEYNRTHEYHIQAIERSIHKGLDNMYKNVIVTHHGPLHECCCTTNAKGSFYTNDLENAIHSDYITMWIYGHTHKNINILRNGVFVTTNQRGMKEKPNMGWNRSSIIRI